MIKSCAFPVVLTAFSGRVLLPLSRCSLTTAVLTAVAQFATYMPRKTIVSVFSIRRMKVQQIQDSMDLYWLLGSILPPRQTMLSI